MMVRAVRRVLYFFFFQAEDGIRYYKVTGVQTCALPISYAVASRDLGVVQLHAGVDAISAGAAGRRAAARLRPLAGLELHPPMYPRSTQIGRASCRERV